MRKIILFVLIAIIVFFAAFITFERPGPKLGNAPDSQESMQISSAAGIGSDPPASQSMYRPYAEGVIGQAERSVLFFTGEGCLFCIQHDEQLKLWNATGALKVPVYAVDFDTEGALKLTYTVVLKDTFILVGRNGGKLKSVIHPNEEELKNLVIGKM